MDLFSNYIQPVTVWLYAHPHWALFIVFLISMVESLAIIGNIIPGSVAMTAIGILAGSGVMSISLTLLAATLGAIIGDSSSYLLGYTLSDRLITIWPFRHYPQWIRYGKEYFDRKGSMSVVIGRFVGPLRPIIPVIAGLMHMSRWRFFIANSFSAVFWALLYILPGVLIGEASSELSPEIATTLFVLILIILAGLWLISIGLKWLLHRANRLVHANLNSFWSWANNNHSFLSKLFKLFAPTHEKEHYLTITLLLLFALSTLLFFITTALVYQATWMAHINYPTHLLFQNLRTHSFDSFFIIVKQITSSTSLIALTSFILLMTIYYRDWRSLKYWLSLNLFCGFFVIMMHQLINSPRPLGIITIQTDNSFPITNLSFATSLFTTLVLYVNAYSKAAFKRPFKIALLCSLLLSGLASVYLEDHWLSDSLGAYFLGLSLCLSHWLLYRRYKSKFYCSASFLYFILLFLLLISSAVSFFIYRSTVRNHEPYFAQYVLTDNIWWNQTKPLLPIYNQNRLGRRIGLFNIQYVGSLNYLEAALVKAGWKKQNYSLFSSILMRVYKRPSSSPKLPLMTQLYSSRAPKLVMTYQPKKGYPTQVLQIWRSNYHLQYFRQPIWLGNVRSSLLAKTKYKKNNLPKINSLHYLRIDPTKFLQRQIHLSDDIVKQLPATIGIEPTLMLLREAEGSDSHS